MSIFFRRIRMRHVNCLAIRILYMRLGEYLTMVRITYEIVHKFDGFVSTCNCYSISSYSYNDTCVYTSSTFYHNDTSMIPASCDGTACAMYISTIGN